MKVLVFGDSIARGAFDIEAWWWVERLKTHYLATYTETGVGVYNCSVSGSDSRGVLQCLDNDVAKILCIEPEDIAIVIAIGTNDPCFIGDRVTVPFEEFRQNFQKILSISLEHTPHVAVVWWFPLDEAYTTPWNDTIYSWKNKDLDQYNQEMKRLSVLHNVSFVDIWDVIRKEHLSDALHPDSLGHLKIYDLMVDYVDTLLEKVNVIPWEI